ncbi:hypothetical protein IMX07_00900 [bacterium]|nr:hypothetical protein [bacterium]
MSEASGKVRENRLRRIAFRQGYKLLKSRARDPRDLTYGGYHLIDVRTGRVRFGAGNVKRDFAASLDQIEQFLMREDGNE